MRHIYIISLFVLTGLFHPMKSIGQTRLTANEHILRPGDSLIKQQISNFAEGGSGMNVIWDFSRAENIYDGQPTEYAGETDSIVLETNQRYCQKHVQRNDSLFLSSFHNRLYDIDYTVPILEMAYPLVFGDTLYSAYSGYGLYCEKNHVYTSGEAHVSADAYGTLILSNNDTLRDVTRIYTLRTSSLRMSDDSVSLHKAAPKMYIEENYKWYARGYRYPLIETIQESYYAGTTPIAYSHTAYRYWADGHGALQNDTVNENILKEDYQQQTNRADIIRYNVSVSGSMVNICYDLDMQAHISIVISDTKGIVYKRHNLSDMQGNGYAVSIDCSNLPHNEYILYINVNNKIYNSKISLK